MSIRFYSSSEIKYPSDNPQEQAAYWFAILQNDNYSEAQFRAFTLWLEESQTHQQAYDDTVMYYEQSGKLSDDELILALRKDALGVGKTRAYSKRNYALIASIAFLFVVISMVSLPFVFNSDKPPVASLQSDEPALADTNNLDLKTAVGEQLTRTLNDGSMIELNTDSIIRVRLSPEQRSIYLLKGQAVFNVAHDESRPFVVFAGDRRVTALGTTFEVRLGDEAAQVTLLEGKVKVDEVKLTDDQQLEIISHDAVELSPGERYVSNTKEMVRVEPQKIESELSWRNGRHIFVDEKLSKIVNELNRYTERKIIIKDPKIGELRASANFKMGSTQSLSAALEATFGLSVTADTASNIITIDW